MHDDTVGTVSLADRCHAPVAVRRVWTVDYFVKGAALVVAYFLTGWLGLLVAIPPGYATAVWPPSGIALAGLLWWGPRHWPSIWLGSFAVNVWASLATTNAEISFAGLALAASIGVGSTLQALVGTILLQRGVGVDRLFERGTSILAFAAIVTLACFLAPTWGVTSLWLAGVVDSAGYFDSWRTWWLGDLLGVLVVTPVALTGRHLFRPDYRPWRAAEAIGSFGLLVAITAIVFAGPSAVGRAQYPLAFLPLPCLVWLAFRFAPGGVALATLFCIGIAVGATSLGSGPFVREVTNDSLMLLQSFMGMATMIGLILAAEGHGQAEEGIRRLNAELEQRVRERTAQLATTVAELEEALSAIKTLKGLVPICSWCKKIRDDQGFWQQLETYLRTHTQADFTHGMCPACVDQQTQEFLGPAGK